ncbi:hypothetical protein BGZ76_003280 [Entomortierella beljakovae]|nr:hypothetical protein BGZ76_003280 [Entomortierella beljakovae]
MAKFTTLLLATVAVLAVSVNAQVSTEAQSISIDRFQDLVSNHPNPFETIEADVYEEADMVILPYPGPHNNNTLVRRATPTAPKKLNKEQQSILDTHNKFRARHQVPPLKWNPKAAAFGNNWIQKCQFKHSGGPYGENLAGGYKNLKKSIEAWYAEEKKYNYKKPGFSGATGHFTQVVWKDTKSVGCAKKFCPNSNWYIYICNYETAGNVVGNNNAYFKKNVLPLKKK